MKLPGPLENVALLDCTLRDGGYYTAWDFDDSTVSTYLDNLAKLPVATVELGYCNLPKDGYFGKYNFLSPRTTAWAKSRLAPDQRLAVMLDEKSVTPAAAARLLSGHAESVDFVRMAVAPTRLTEAHDLGAALRELGFAVGINIMYLSSYWESVASLDGLTRLAEVSSEISLVDSYGACLPEQVRRAVLELREALPSVDVGFHGHDNLGLAFANSIVAAESGAATIDGTLTGMGRGPGNTRTELLLVSRATGGLHGLDFDALDHAAAPFEALKARFGWGTNLAYMISGAAGLPQNDVMDWLSKNRYSVSAIIQALQNRQVDDVDASRYPELASSGSESREVILIGGGPSVATHAESIAEYARRSGAIVVHANYRHLGMVARLEADQYLCLAGDVATRLPPQEELARLSGLIVPSGPRFHSPRAAADLPVHEVGPFVIDSDARSLGPVSDIGPLSLALGAAVALGATSIVLVGFDGYENATLAQQHLSRDIQETLDAFRVRHPGIRCSSATRTTYSIAASSIYSRLVEIDLP